MNFFTRGGKRDWREGNIGKGGHEGVRKRR